ncbi:MAG TPA: hypothetical protein VGP03_10395 [Pseudonocardiaceae bacterium]|jgi:hypothetical protein|nr:hypothetical protein [Pseudonocardiaceae bacterium]
MGHSKQQHIAKAFEELAATRAHQSDTSSDSELLIAMSDLAAISGLVGQLATQTRQELAEWATVGPHLRQAQEFADGLARCLNHAAGTLAFNSALQPA